MTTLWSLILKGIEPPFLNQQNHRPAEALGNGQLVEYVRIVTSQQGDAEFVIQNAMEHAVADRSRLLHLIRSERREIAFRERRLNDELEHLIRVFPNFGALETDRADNEAAL